MNPTFTAVTLSDAADYTVEGLDQRVVGLSIGGTSLGERVAQLTSPMQFSSLPWLSPDMGDEPVVPAGSRVGNRAQRRAAMSRAERKGLVHAPIVKELS